jgi:catechol 2,3-dioxygenase-like lactoylglutathione lyase family enzyme
MPNATAPFQQSVCFFPCADLDATQHFYEETLGLPMVLDQGACRIFQVSSSGFVGFCTHRQPEAVEGPIITLVTTEVEQVTEALERAGVRFEAPLSRNERFNITHAFLRDPDGYLVELQRFDDPRWPGAP